MCARHETYALETYALEACHGAGLLAEVSLLLHPWPCQCFFVSSAVTIWLLGHQFQAHSEGAPVKHRVTKSRQHCLILNERKGILDVEKLLKCKSYEIKEHKDIQPSNLTLVRKTGTCVSAGEPTRCQCDSIFNHT